MEKSITIQGCESDVKVRENYMNCTNTKVIHFTSNTDPDARLPWKTGSCRSKCKEICSISKHRNQDVKLWFYILELHMGVAAQAVQLRIEMLLNQESPQPQAAHNQESPQPMGKFLNYGSSHLSENFYYYIGRCLHSPSKNIHRFDLTTSATYNWVEINFQPWLNVPNLIPTGPPVQSPPQWTMNDVVYSKTSNFKSDCFKTLENDCFN